MKKLVSLIYFLGFSIIVLAQKESDGVIVLELFTSQGCSSCPPADQLLDQIRQTKQDENVFVVSYHVDYWNRLGWKDPFSQPKFTSYQQSYAQQFQSRSIYTPQVVANGAAHFVGSNATALQSALRNHATTTSDQHIQISQVQHTQKDISFSYSIEGKPFDHAIFTVVVAERITTVSRGENRNRILKNSNIVVNYEQVEQPNGTLKISLPDWILPEDQVSIIAYTKSSSKTITGAAQYAVAME